MEKSFIFVIMILAIPIDFVLWNIFYGKEYGYRSFLGCCKDGWKQWVSEYGKELPSRGNP